ncbi:cytochrome P450 [Algoriphagus sp. H41]|uniref:Cytochrome P450 n=1 Tax=Algoriphagus oliviformis TaxID=2811231 RepID=A0ABS3C8C3_9BACT|nr:cytochrome P450 [Algoriphagus oliviformis]MBN7813364.1 cytochrome P450 [Algoriphagus oliviformis]
MKESELPDPFAQIRADKGYAEIDDQGDPVTMLLRLKDVRKTAHNYQAFTSETVPGRIVVPSEVSIRNTRQIPFEVDPPMHGAYRAMVEPWFKRPLEEQYQEQLAAIVSGLFTEVAGGEKIEVVHDFALPLQSRALTLLLNTPMEEAARWISWGTHVFRSEGEALDGSKADVLYDYIDAKLKEAESHRGEDLFSLLMHGEVHGRKLSREEAKGVMVLTFAGGRDTVINAVTNSLAHFAGYPEDLERLRREPELVNTAVEEMIRYFSPLTHMGRVVTQDTQVCEHAVKADSRVSLCWASANRDETVFEEPDRLKIDRKVNPHVGFGFSHHNCLGATHARQVMRILLKEMIQNIEKVELVEARDNIEVWGDFHRKVGFHSLQVRLHPKN